MSPAVRRAAALVAVALVLATVCTLLGRWQWGKHVRRDATNAVVEQSWAAETVDLAAFLTPGEDLPADEQWRSVRLVGTYDGGAPVLLRNRPVDGQGAYHVLGAFTVAGSGAVLVVDRGWVPVGDGSPDVPEPPTGTVTLTVRLRTGEAPTTRTAPAGQVQALAVPQVVAAAGLPEPAGGLYVPFGVLRSEQPSVASDLQPLPAPDVDPGPYLSYAFQWWVFAVGGLVGFGVLARRELVEGRTPLPDGAGPTAPDTPAPVPALPDGARRSPRRRGRAELEEDALVEAQLARGTADRDGAVTPGR